MKKVIKNPVFLLVAGALIGIITTRIGIKNEWNWITGGTISQKDKDFVPEGGKIQGVAAMSETEVSAAMSNFSSLMGQMVSGKTDSAKAEKIMNTGGLIHKDLLKFLLGKLPDSSNYIPYYFGVEPGSNHLGIIFNTGTGAVKSDANSMPTILDATYLNLEQDSTTVCPPNCPIPGPMPQPEPGPQPAPVPQPEPNPDGNG